MLKIRVWGCLLAAIDCELGWSYCAGSVARAVDGDFAWGDCGCGVSAGGAGWGSGAESGGNAVDAAIATNAMMGVVEPMMNGIGGDLFAIVYDAKANKLYGLNASGWAPKALTIEFLHKQGCGICRSTGCMRLQCRGGGWMARAGGKIRAKETRRGFGGGNSSSGGRVSGSRVDSCVLGRGAGLIAYRRSGNENLFAERQCAAGWRRVRNADLGASLRQIAEHGSDAFYKERLRRKFWRR